MAPPTFVVDQGRTAKCPGLACLTRALDAGLVVPGLSRDTKRHQLQTRITDFAEVERDKRTTKVALLTSSRSLTNQVGSEEPIRKIEAFIDWAIETVDRRMYENRKA
jgi:hypothetical protein